MKESRYETLKTLLLGNEYRYDFETNEVYNKDGKRIKPYITNYGGIVYNLKSKKYSKQQIVAVMAGFNIVNKKCFFKNGNNKDFKLDNMIWIEDENYYKYKNRNKKGVKLEFEVIDFIRNEKELNNTELAILCGVSYQHISRIKNYHKWN